MKCLNWSVCMNHVHVLLYFTLIIPENFPVISTPSDTESDEFSSVTLDCNITNYGSFEVSAAVFQ